MDFKKTMRIIYALYSGTILHYFSILIPREYLAGATTHGYPYAWALKVLVSPEYGAFLWKIKFTEALLNLGVWSLVGFIGIIIWERLRK